MKQIHWKSVYILLLSIITVAETTDASYDFYRSGFSLQTAMDLMMVLLVFGGIAYIVRNSSSMILRAESDSKQAREDLKEFRKNNEGMLLRLRGAVREQFRHWKFSPAEERIAELLIRGFSTRQIAALLEKSDRTVRNQATALYQKSGMTGRSDLSAFFLEDILGDMEQEPGEAEDPETFSGDASDPA